MTTVLAYDPRQPKKAYKRKYRNQPVHDAEYGRFDSKAEHKEWHRLLARQASGEIRNLERQVRFDIVINGKKCGFWKADYSYFKGNKRVVSDKKSDATRKEKYWRFKKKVLEALFGFEIQEV